MTPNEAYFQKYISTRCILDFTAEMIRQRVIERTKFVGAQKNYTVGPFLKEGDDVLVKRTMAIKIRADGQRLIIPSKENPRYCKYTFKAQIAEIIGNAYNLRWMQESPELGLTKGDIVYNVPLTMFTKDFAFV